MTSIPQPTARRHGPSLTDELRFDVLGHQALHTRTVDVSDSAPVLDRIDAVLEAGQQ